MKDVFLKKWSEAGDKILLSYEDGTEFYVNKTDFNRAFGCIISRTKDVIRRDFAIA